jgi:multidrug transporter EmrE-like cation transporter
MGILFLGEPAGAARLACLALVVLGIVGLKVAT